MTKANRVWMIVFGAMLTLLPPLRLAVGRNLGDWNWERALPGFVASLPFGLGTIAFALFAYRKRAEAEPVAEFMPDDWPGLEDLPRCAVAEWVGITGRTSRVVVASWCERIYFERCYTPNKFLAVPLRYHSRPLEDLIEFRVIEDRGGRRLQFRTVDGKGELPFRDDGETESVVEALTGRGFRLVSGFDFEATGLTLVTIFYALAGGIGGAMLTTPRMDSASFYGRILGGAALATTLALAVVFRLKRSLGESPTMPVFGFLFGLVGGWLAGEALIGAFGREFFINLFGPHGPVVPRSISILLGPVVGILLGILIQFPPWRDGPEPAEPIGKKRGIPEL